MSIFTNLTKNIENIRAELINSAKLPPEAQDIKFTLDVIKDEKLGDIATNIAMTLSKVAKKAPKDIAPLFVEQIKKINGVEKVELAMPGFINITFSNVFWQEVLKNIIENGIKSTVPNIGMNELINVEYVSANPTGPLHVGHVRGAVFGDVMANLLIKMGYNVTKEYYVNDAGGQVNTLARSLFFRYQELFNIEQGELPAGCYPGEYLIDCAKILKEKDGNKWCNKSESEYLDYFRTFATSEMLKTIKVDLLELGVKHDIFTSEATITTKEAVSEVLEILNNKGYLYKGILEPPKGIEPDEDFEPREQLLFKSTNFGDDMDRALQKSDGSNTYFLGDMVYHYNKYKRSSKKLINVWGADHFGYIKRIKSAVSAFSNDAETLEVVITQMVNLSDNGVVVKMSKRAGTFVTLREIVDRVGKDVVRYSMIMRQADMPIFFDFAKAVEQTRENPIFYVQYANARINSVLKNVKEQMGEIDEKPDLSVLTNQIDIEIIKILARYPKILESATLFREVHRITLFLNDLATAVHSYWNKGKEDENLKFIILDNKKLTIARVSLLKAVQETIKDALEILGIEPIESM